MKKVIRITTEGKIRPVRRRALGAIPAVEDREETASQFQLRRIGLTDYIPLKP
jgi:hypothetical protein